MLYNAIWWSIPSVCLTTNTGLAQIIAPIEIFRLIVSVPKPFTAGSATPPERNRSIVTFTKYSHPTGATSGKRLICSDHCLGVITPAIGNISGTKNRQDRQKRQDRSVVVKPHHLRLHPTFRHVQSAQKTKLRQKRQCSSHAPSLCDSRQHSGNISGNNGQGAGATERRRKAIKIRKNSRTSSICSHHVDGLLAPSTNKSATFPATISATIPTVVPAGLHLAARPFSLA